MDNTIKVIEAIGRQWPFLIVLFIILIILFNWKAFKKIISHITIIKYKDWGAKIDNKEFKNEESDELDDSRIVSSDNVKFISKEEASKIFLEKLNDINTKNIKIITYTNEVEAGQINHYKVRGEKEIEVFKRSLASELYEQQKTNINRLQLNKNNKYWNKKNLLIDSTEKLEKEFSSNSQIKVKHYFYSYPPTKRAYIFNDSEAIYSYYEYNNDQTGSAYKGMGGIDRFWISNTTKIGKYLINELLNEVKLLKMHSRTLEDEAVFIKNERNQRLNFIETPVNHLKAVFFDMDGVLYDSLSYYKIAWKEAFLKLNVEINDDDVYMHEGRSGNDTISILTNKYLHRYPTIEEIQKIKLARNEKLLNLGKPSIQKGIIKLLDKIKTSGLQIWIVTGSSKDNVKNELLEDFNQYVDLKQIITGNDVIIGKPSPEPYLLALYKSGFISTEVIVIENAPLGIESSKRAGIYTIAVNTGNLNEKSLYNFGADNIFKDCDELRNYWDDIYKIFNL